MDPPAIPPRRASVGPQLPPRRSPDVLAARAAGAPTVQPVWCRAVDVPCYDPAKPTTVHCPPHLHAIAIASSSSGSPTATTTSSSNSSSAQLPIPAAPYFPAVWDLFDDKDAARLEAMYAKVAHWMRSRRDGAATADESASSGDQNGLHLAPPFNPRVMVEEHLLHEVNVHTMLRYPIYWPGAIVEVRRAVWFVPAPSTPVSSSAAAASPTALTKFIPCDPHLARQIEAGYLKTKPWTFTPVFDPNAPQDALIPPKPVRYNVPDHRVPLFGAELGKYAVFTDPCTAFVRDDSAVSKLQRTVLAAMGAPPITAGGGLKLIRGYENLPHMVAKRDAELKAAAAAAAKAGGSVVVAAAAAAAASREAAIAAAATSDTADPTAPTASETSAPASKAPSIVGTASDSDEPLPLLAPDAAPDHLLLAIHGIGAKLSEHIEWVSFVNDCGDLRKGMTAAITGNAKERYRAKNIYVLPVQWRQAIRFATEPQAIETDSSSECSDEDDDWSTAEMNPAAAAVAAGGVEAAQMDMAAAIHRRNGPASWKDVANKALGRSSTNVREPTAMDMVATGSASASAEPDADPRMMPSLEELTIDGVPAIRTLVSDVVLDVLLYLTPRFRAQIMAAVAAELNRVYKLFRSRYPDFSGNVSVLGHSLGSIIALELLSGLPDATADASVETPEWRHVPHVDAYLSAVVSKAAAPTSSPAASPAVGVTPPPPVPPRRHRHRSLEPPQPHALAFNVDHFFCVGSPSGYFLLLQGARLRARISGTNRIGKSVKRPKCNHMYNVFSIYDPVAVRLEPLVSRSLVGKAPYKIPYHKGGLKGLQQGVEQMTTRAWDAVASLFKPSTQNAARALVESTANAVHAEAANVEEEPTGRRGRRRRTKSLDDGIKALNPRYGRVDFALQQGVLENPYLAALSTHTAYWADLDVSCFVANEILRSCGGASTSVSRSASMDAVSGEGGADAVSSDKKRD
ncbi:hypothetical protein GGF31_005739 [Allomyces arbusculus]|nr:hypothetical protein GGF31_005739 [Allomyces arbusculus]